MASFLEGIFRFFGAFMNVAFWVGIVLIVLFVLLFIGMYGGAWYLSHLAI